MILLLFFLSYYEEQIEIASLNYFTKFLYLEYGFKKSSQYSINFSKTAPEMVFGYATKEEIEEIEYHKNDQSYCQGKKQLSRVQNYISGGPIAIQGKILLKGKLIPYIFSCNKSYIFKLGINYANTQKHLDYRCQDAQIYTIFFFIVFLLINIFIILYFKYKRPLAPPFNLLLLLIIFIIFCLQSLASFFSLTIHNEWEYLYRNASKNYDKDFFQSMSFVFSRSCIVVTFCVFIYINYIYCDNENNFDLYHKLISTIVSVVGAIGSVVSSIFTDKFSIVIPFCVSFYLIFAGGFLSFKIQTSFFRVAVSLYILVMIFDFYYVTVYSSQPPDITKHVPLLYSIVASIVAQTVFSVLTLVGVIWKGEFCSSKSSIPIAIKPHGTYTNVSESLNDISDKNNS